MTTALNVPQLEPTPSTSRKIEVITKRLKNVGKIKDNLEEMLEKLKDHELGCKKNFGELSDYLTNNDNMMEDRDDKLKDRKREVEHEINSHRHKPQKTIVIEEEAVEIPPAPRPAILPPDKHAPLHPPPFPKKRERVLTQLPRKFEKRIYTLPDKDEWMELNKPPPEELIVEDEEEKFEEELSSSSEDEETKQSLEKKKMVESEQPDALLLNINKKKLKELDPEALKILGDPRKFKIPKKGIKKKKLDRDMRKIELGLKDASPEDRKLAKLSMLKYYDVLYQTFEKYCKVGGDRGWLSKVGWNRMHADAYIPQKNTKCDKDWVDKSFNGTYAYHNPPRPKNTKRRSARIKKHKKTNSKRFSGFMKQQTITNFSKFEDEDPWSGIWQLISDDGGDKYKLKQAGDTKIVGCIKSHEWCEISGHMDPVNGTKAKLIIQWKEGPRKNTKRKLKCQLLPPKGFIDKIRMEVKWQEINEDLVKENSGTEIWHKWEPLEDEEGLPITIGLGRHEFLDNMLVVAAQRYPNMRKWRSLITLIEDNLLKYIWGSVDKVKAVDKKNMFRRAQTELHKLFNKYAAFDDINQTATDDGIGLDEYLVFCSDLFEAPTKLNKFSNGGKPKTADIKSVFNLSIENDWEDELMYPQFEKSVEYLADYLYKKHPSPQKYVTPPKLDRLKLILDWCVKLQKANKRLNKKKLIKVQKQIGNEKDD